MWTMMKYFILFLYTRVRSNFVISLASSLHRLYFIPLKLTFYENNSLFLMCHEKNKKNKI